MLRQRVSRDIWWHIQFRVSAKMLLGPLEITGLGCYRQGVTKLGRLWAVVGGPRDRCTDGVMKVMERMRGDWGGQRPGGRGRHEIVS